MNRNKKERTIHVFAAAVCVVFLVCSFVFINSLQQENHDISMGVIRDSIKQEREILESQIESDFQILRGIATGLSSMGLDGNVKIQEMLSEISSKNKFAWMGLVGRDGIIDLAGSDGQVYSEFSFLEQPFFQKALAGQETISETVRSAVSGQYVNYYAVPVLENGKVKAVLCAVHSADVLWSLLNAPVFIGEGTFIIVDRRGTVVASSTAETAELQDGKKLSCLVGLAAAERVKLHELLDSGASGTQMVGAGDEKYVMMTEPLMSGEWILVSSVSDVFINQYFTRTVAGVSRIVFVSGIIFCFLMWWHYKCLIRNRLDLEYIAYTDPLTGLNNYTKFLVEAPKLLKNAKREKYAVWSIDIKQFKNINDIFGYHVGDNILKGIAELLCIPATGELLLCHVAADHFAGIISYQSKAELILIFSRLSRAVSELQNLTGNQMQITLIGGFYCVDDFNEELTIEDMVNRSVIAKTAVKKLGSKNYAFFNQEMSEAVRRENEIVAYGKEALRNGDICFFLQPKVNILEGNRVIGAEVLARWKHKEHGWISPAEFIPAFENNGMIIELDRSIYEQACKWYQTYLSRGGQPINLAVNVSRLGVFQEDFFEYYKTVREQYGLQAIPVELELTESVIVEDYSRFINMVLKLQECGFICSMDDFGAGHSSLNALKSLPIDVLKLDAMFFRGAGSTIREELVLEGVVSMMKKLNITTVAEGVESWEQVEFLRRINCELVQGYVFSKPVSPEEFEALMMNTGGVMEVL